MGGRYEIRFYSNTKLARANGGYETVYTNSFIEFIELRLTKKLIYYKVNY